MQNGTRARSGGGAVKRALEFVPSFMCLDAPPRTDQPAALIKMVDDERPVINPDRHLRHLVRVDSTRRQFLETAREIICVVAKRTARKGQIAGRAAVEIEMLTYSASGSARDSSMASLRISVRFPRVTSVVCGSAEMMS